MKALRTIVVGVDFSEASTAALHEALRLAQADGARVVAVKVVLQEVLEHQVTFHKVAPEQAIERVNENLRTHLADEGADGGVEHRVLVGSPFASLNEVIVEEQADLLVLGSRGWEHGVGRIGAVASKCVRRAPVPVLLVRRRHHGPFQRILACTDFSAEARRALDHAFHLADREGSAVDVVHVDLPVWLQPAHVQFDLEAEPDEDYREQYRAALRDRLASEVAALDPPADVQMAQHVLEDIHPSKRLASFADGQGNDLIVLGTTGRNAVTALFLGTTAERLLHHTACSVLAVKEKGEVGG